MRKILVVVCLIAGCSYGMQVPEETKATASVDMSVVQENGRAVKLEMNNTDFINKWQGVTDPDSDADTEDNVFETLESTYKEGRFWTVVRKVFQPVQIISSVSTMALIAGAEMVKTSNESLSTGLSYGAFGTAVSSGILSIFITKMNSKIHSLNKRYKAQLATTNNRNNLEAEIVVENN